MSKVSIIGAGNVGATAAYKIAHREICDEIVLLDIKPGVAEGKAIDICQSGVLEQFDTKVIGVTNDYEKTSNSDIIVVTSGIPRKPGMTREELVEVNSKVMESVLSETSKYSPNAIYIIVSNPMDTMTYFAYKYLKISAKKVIGMGGLLDSARFCNNLAEKLNVPRSEIWGMVIGGHGDTTMVPLISTAYHNDTPISDLLTKEEIEEVIQETMKGGATLTNLIGTSAWEAPAAGIVGLVEALFSNTSTYIPCSVYREGYDVCIGSIVLINSHGIKEIVPEDNLTETENSKFLKSVLAVKVVNKALPTIK